MNQRFFLNNLGAYLGKYGETMRFHYYRVHRLPDSVELNKGRAFGEGSARVRLRRKGMSSFEKIPTKERLLELVNNEGFIINIDITENKIHTPDCYFVGSMNPEKKEGGIYYSSEINEMISHFDGLSFYKCFYCDPILETTESGGKSIEILEKETKGLPMWNLVMPPAWEQYYIKKAGRILSDKKEKEENR